MVFRALLLTSLLAAAPAVAQTSQTANPALTPSSAGAGDSRQASTPIQDPTLGSQAVATGSKKAHRAKRAHRTSTKSASAAPGMS